MDTYHPAPATGLQEWVDDTVRRQLAARLREVVEQAADELRARARRDAGLRWPRGAELREAAAGEEGGASGPLVDALADALKSTAARLTAPELAAPELAAALPPPTADLNVPEDLPATLPELRQRSLSTAEAAGRLGVNPSRIRQRLLARTLFGFKDKDGWWLPELQFEGGQVVPGADQVFTAIRPEANPLKVARWFLTSWEDLVIDEDWEVVLSPRQWLLEGRDPAPVVFQARFL